MFLVFYSPFALLALSDVSVNASLDSSTLNQGWPIKGTLEITHDESQKVDENSVQMDGKDLKVNLLRNVRIAPPSPLTVSIYQFTVPSKNKGAYTLPALSVKVGEKTYQTFSIPYEVQGPVALPQVSGGVPQKSLLKLEAFVEGPKELYPGQLTTLVYRYTYEGNIALSKETLPMLEAKGLQKIGRSEMNNYTQGNASIFEISQKVQAEDPGEFSWGPSVVEGVVYEEDALGNKQFTTQKLSSEAPPVTLTVKPFPLEGKPASFNGAFGQLDFQVTLTSPAKVSVGDPITLAGVISGQTSNWDSVKLPELCCQPGFGGFFKLGDLPPAGKMEAGKKHFSIELNALSPAIKSIPAIQFSFFEPETGKYKTLYSQPLAISVSPVQEISQVGQNAQQKQENFASQEKILDWLKIYKQMPELNMKNMFYLEPSDLKNKLFGSWWVLWLIPLSIALIPLQLKFKKYLEEQTYRRKMETSEEVYKNMLQAPATSPLFFQLLKKSLLLRLFEKGQIFSPSTGIETLSTEGQAGKVRDFLLHIDKVRYSGPFNEKDLYKEALEKGKELYKDL